jgi:hypothetical protein
MTRQLRTSTSIYSFGIACLFTAALSKYATVADVRAAGTIAYVGVIRDQTDFDHLKIGKAGYWFPQFGANSPVGDRSTGENACDALPNWVTPFNHVTSILDPAFKTRTFSQDGPAQSMGGIAKWNTFKLPNGKSGRSGAIVDPFAHKNSNNTINRIQLRKGVPSTFFFHVVTDNTNREYDPTIRLRARGNSNGVDIDASPSPSVKEFVFNGTADVYTYRCEGFQAGDFLKLQLSGDSPIKMGRVSAEFYSTLPLNRTRGLKSKWRGSRRLQMSTAETSVRWPGESRAQKNQQDACRFRNNIEHESRETGCLAGIARV